MHLDIELYTKVLEAVGPDRGIFSWSWFGGNVAQVVALVCCLGGVLLNFKTDSSVTKLVGILMIIAAVAILIIRVLYSKDILPL